jgi:hypothetical protein
MDVPRRVRRQAREAPTRWIEPPWKAILSNKGILPLLWEMFPEHPNLLPAYFEDDPKRASSAHPSCASRSIRARAPMSRWSAPAHAGGTARPLWRGRLHPAGACAAAEFLRAISGARQLAGRSHAVRLSIREDENPITGNTSRFLPHAIL